VSEVIRESFRSAFEFFEDAFDGIPIPVGDVLESERVTMAGRLEPGCAIDQEERIVDEMFLAEFSQRHLGYCEILGREQSHVEQAGGVRVDCRIQPIALIIHPNHRFVDRDVIRVPPLCRL
jgi:hypothetical protein